LIWNEKKKTRKPENTSSMLSCNRAMLQCSIEGEEKFAKKIKTGEWTCVSSAGEQRGDAIPKRSTGEEIRQRKARL